MTISTMEPTATAQEVKTRTAEPIETDLFDLFDLSVETVEVADPCGLINMTDNGCSSTCGACTTGAA